MTDTNPHLSGWRRARCRRWGRSSPLGNGKQRKQRFTITTVRPHEQQCWTILSILCKTDKFPGINKFQNDQREGANVRRDYQRDAQILHVDFQASH